MLLTSTPAFELPQHLGQELDSLRRDADLLAHNGKVRRSLATLAERIGTVLVREARRPSIERGYRMAELSLYVDRLFPELRDLHDREVNREGRQHQEQVRIHRQAAVPVADRRGA